MTTVIAPPVGRRLGPGGAFYSSHNVLDTPCFSGKITPSYIPSLGGTSQDPG